MGYSKKELKMYIRYLKKTIKILSKMEYSWRYNPLGSNFNTIKDLNEELKYFQNKLNEVKNY